MEMGVRKGDRVMVYIPNCAQWVIAFLAIQKIGAVLVPISPIYTSFEIEYMLKDSGAETVICQDTNFGYVKEVLPATAVKRVIVTNMVDLLPLWKRSLGFLFDKVPRREGGEGRPGALLHVSSEACAGASRTSNWIRSRTSPTSSTPGGPRGSRKASPGTTSE